MRDGIQVGELAARFGLNPKTIRYYEEIGLLPPAYRSKSGYRRYDERDVERLGFIRRAKLLGLSLDEIRDLLSHAECGEQICHRVLDLIAVKIGEVDRQIHELQAFRAELTSLHLVWTDRDGRCQRVPTSAHVCPIIEEQTGVFDHPDLVRILEPVAPRRSS